MSATEQARPAAALPSPAELDKAHVVLRDSLDVVEQVASSLQAYSDKFYGTQATPPDAPDDAYIGALWRFTDDIDLELGDLRSMLAKLRNLLGEISSIGRDVDFRATLDREATDG